MFFEILTDYSHFERNSFPGACQLIWCIIRRQDKEIVLISKRFSGPQIVGKLREGGEEVKN